MQLINRARLALPAALLIGTGILAPTGAFAHEHRDSTNGMYTMVVGWQTEPPIPGQANAHELSHAFSSQARAWLASQSMAATAARDDAMPGMDHHDMSEMAGQ
jgi:hypothetical protein